MTVVIILVIVSNLFWGIASALLTNRRGRNAWNWFFLSCIYGWYSLILLACSKTLNKGESDTLSKVLWSLVILPIIAIVLFYFIIYPTIKRDYEIKKEVQEEMRDKITNYPWNSNPNEDDYNWDWGCKK